jgi:malate dehydrogenase
MKKVTIIGSGNVGSSCALYVSEKRLADVVLIDVVQGLAYGRALDSVEAAPIRNYDTRITGSTDFSEMENSDVVIMTAGKARTPGMSRDDLLQVNAKIITSVSKEIARYAPNAVLIMVSNPLDVMSYLALKVTGFALKRVVGMAGVLDSTRFRYFLADKMGVSVADTNALVLGGHGDSMVPLPRYATVNGIPIQELLPKDTIDKLIERTRKGGAEIVGYLKTGSAFWAPAAAAAEMAECVIRDKMRILPASAYLRGEYGIDGLFVGVPVKLGMNGVEDIIELSLSKEENEALQNSAAGVKAVIEKLEEMNLL